MGILSYIYLQKPTSLPVSWLFYFFVYINNIITIYTRNLCHNVTVFSTTKIHFFVNQLLDLPLICMIQNLILHRLLKY